jgi:hypothetical protein
MFHQVYFHTTPPPFEHYLEQALAEGEIELRIDGLAYAPTNPQPQPGAQPGANVYTHFWCTRGPESVRQRNHG